MNGEALHFYNNSFGSESYLFTLLEGIYCGYDCPLHKRPNQNLLSARIYHEGGDPSSLRVMPNNHLIYWLNLDHWNSAFS